MHREILIRLRLLAVSITSSFRSIMLNATMAGWERNDSEERLYVSKPKRRIVNVLIAACCYSTEENAVWSKAEKWEDHVFACQCWRKRFIKVEAWCSWRGASSLSSCRSKVLLGWMANWRSISIFQQTNNVMSDAIAAFCFPFPAARFRRLNYKKLFECFDYCSVPFFALTMRISPRLHNETIPFES